MQSYITLEGAIEILNDSIKRLAIEEVELNNGVGKILAEDVLASIDSPPFNKSAMDGYAVIARKYEKSRLQVIDKVYAGDISKSVVTELSTVKIMTGAPIPEGANAVVKQEDVVIEKDYIIIDKEVQKNENLCFKGEDFIKGTKLVQKNKLLNHSDIGIIASTGLRKIKVIKKPIISFITTGNEVIDINEELNGGKIYNSNKYSIISRLRELCYSVNYMNHSEDTITEIANEIKLALSKSDVLITTGGVSVGEKDFLKEAILSIGGEILFWKVLIKPGSAIVCSKIGDKFVFSLSGNPTAALTTFELLVRPSLDMLSGKEEISIKREKAYLCDDINKVNKQKRYIRGKYFLGNGKVNVSVTQKKSGNGILSSTLESNCLIEIPANTGAINKNSLVDIIRL